MTFTVDSPLRDAGQDDSQEDALQDEFLGALAALGGSAGNGRLRDVLEWDEASYEAVNSQLLSRGLIVPGRGRGGSVALSGGNDTTGSATAN
ncbi:MAG: hypothetical protein ACK4V5_13080, partial [Cyanobium sp.]